MTRQPIYSFQVRSRVAIVCLLLASFLPMNAFAAIKAGSTCQVLGKKSISNGASYTCIKSGNKRIWKKDVVIKKTISSLPKPTPTPTKSVLPSPAPTITPTPSASTTPSPTISMSESTSPIPAIIKISDLPTNFKYIKYWAYTKANDAIKSNSDNVSPIEVLVGPNSKACYQDMTLNAVRLLQKVYGQSKLPKKLWLLYADMDVDRQWIENKTLTLLSADRVWYNKNKQMGAVETVNASGEGIVWAQNSCASTNGTKISSDVLHAYTHTIQDLQYSDFPNGYGRWGEVPRWLIEGGASWSQIFYESNNILKKYENSGDWGVLSSYDKNFFNQYLLIPAYSNNLWQYTDQWPEMRAYDLGAYVCDMLIALKGPSSIIELNKDYLVTGNFETSFRNIFGMSWAEAQPYFSNAAYSLINWLAA